MLCPPRFLVRVLGACGALALLAGCAPVADGAAPAGQPARQPTVQTEVPAGDRFDSPEAIVKRFRTELGRMVGRQGVVPPVELARQAETNKTCTVSTLSDPGKKLDAEAVYGRARRSVVIVGGITRCDGGRHWHASCATGFVVHKDGVIVTNAHVVEAFAHMDAMGVMTDDGRVFPIKAVLAADGVNDVAVLKIAADDLAPLPLATGTSIGATVYCLSHPELNAPGSENGFFAFTRGMVCGKFRLRLGGGPAVNVLAITADYAKGSSGGPILNENGAVVAMVCSTMALIDDGDGNVQMTWKFTRPSSSILPLLRGDSTAQRSEGLEAK